MAVGILALLEAQPGKGEQLEAFLVKGREGAVREEQTITWHAFKIDETTFGIFDTFEGEEGREAHMSGEIAAALGEVAGELLAGEPDIKFVDIVAVK